VSERSAPDLALARLRLPRQRTSACFRSRSAFFRSRSPFSRGTPLDRGLLACQPLFGLAQLSLRLSRGVRRLGGGSARLDPLVALARRTVEPAFARLADFVRPASCSSRTASLWGAAAFSSSSARRLVAFSRSLRACLIRLSWRLVDTNPGYGGTATAPWREPNGWGSAQDALPSARRTRGSRRTSSAPFRGDSAWNRANK
jgi:hypothetical protein